MQLVKLLLIILTYSFSSKAPADEVKGVIETSGPPNKRKISLIHENGTAHELCHDVIGFQIIQLAGAVLTVSGDPKFDSTRKSRCLQAKSYVINEIIKGRPAVVGFLRQPDKGIFKVIDQSGKSWRLAGISSGVRDLLDYEVVCDLVPYGSASGETTWSVARIFAKPK